MGGLEIFFETFFLSDPVWHRFDGRLGQVTLMGSRWLERPGVASLWRSAWTGDLNGVPMAGAMQCGIAVAVGWDR